MVPQIIHIGHINIDYLIKSQVHKFFIKYFLCFFAWVFVNILELFVNILELLCVN